jgi:hypothetical protein
MFLYINGERMTGAAIAAGLTLDNNTDSLKIGALLPGCIKEVRVWKKGKDDLLIKRDHSRYTAANELGLILMLNMSEGVGSFAYDRSYTGATNFNKNHAQFINTVLWTTDIPTISQLSYASYTDSTGNYQITLPYFNAGENYVITPVFFPHEFEPKEKLLFIGDGSTVINGVDFKDVSSFRVTGTLFYKDTPCPVAGAQLSVDGKVVTIGNSPVTTQADGSFEVQVPIGFHELTVSQGSHVYNAGSTGFRNFQAPVTGIEFEDSTLVKVIGRVIGGVREAKKPAGFGYTINNIGMAQFKYKTQNGCFEKTVQTDVTTGEYTVFLPPMKYDVLDLDIISPESPISFESQSALELTGVPPVQIEYDTLPNNIVRSI